MNFEDYDKYWQPARDCFVERTREGHVWKDDLTFAAMLDMVDSFKAFTSRPHTADSPMDNDLKQLLMLLAGPHGKTMLKAYQARKGLR